MNDNFSSYGRNVFFGRTVRETCKTEKEAKERAEKLNREVVEKHKQEQRKRKAKP